MTPTALVTGASGGIGSATARELGKDHDVVVHYNSDEESAQSVANDVEANGQEALVHHCDLNDSGAIEEMIDRISDELEGVDVLVNNAGVFHAAALETTSDDTVRERDRLGRAGRLSLFPTPGRPKTRCARRSITRESPSLGRNRRPAPRPGATVTRRHERCRGAVADGESSPRPAPRTPRPGPSGRRPRGAGRGPGVEGTPLPVR